MARRLVELYEQATKELGTIGRVKLAMLTKIPSTKAAETPDTPVNIETFEKALAQLRAG
jgi:hypothetical protein